MFFSLQIRTLYLIIVVHKPGIQFHNMIVDKSEILFEKHMQAFKE
jgi:hypothetical protein